MSGMWLSSDSIGSGGRMREGGGFEKPSPLPHLPDVSHFLFLCGLVKGSFTGKHPSRRGGLSIVDC